MKNKDISKKVFANIFWAVSALMVLAILFAVFGGSFKKAPQILTINQLVEKINNNGVEKIVVQGNDLAITLKNGEEAAGKKETDASLTETLKNYSVSQQALGAVTIDVREQSGARFWLSVILPTVLPILFMILLFWWVFKQAGKGVNQAFSFARSNIKLFMPFKERVTFKDVAGLKEAKQELIEVVEFLKSPDKFLKIGARIPRGVLLLGLPGTGKTLLARAIAGESGVPFFYISASEFVELFVGVGAARTRDAFAVAKKAAPAILFIDEIDAVGRQRGAGLGGGHDEREQTLNQILVEMDGFERDTRVIVLAATNRPDILDSALLRPGRFDRRIILDMPDINDREAILKVHGRDKKIDRNVDLRKIAIRTPGFTGADLANLMNEAALLAARRNGQFIEQQDLYEAIEKVILGPARRGRAISEKEKAITAYHEAGHALITASLKGSDPIQKISIISRGLAGGYTLKLPLEEQRIRTRTQFLNDLATMLGGYATERVIFNDISTGASNDLKEASEVVRKLVAQYGMSEEIGPITFGKTEELVFLGREIATEKNYSEETAKKIDAEINRIMKKILEIDINILKKRKKALDDVAKALISKEILEGEDFYGMLKPFKFRLIEIKV